MIFLRLINYINSNWNYVIGLIHDLSAKAGVGHWTVWFYDTFTWHLSNDLTIVGGKRYAEYLLEHELRIQEHQTRYYANLAYDLMWEKLGLIDSEIEELESQKESVLNSENTEEEFAH